MCIGFWSSNHADYSLVVCANRDEYLSRPTESAHWHSFESLQGSGSFSQGSMSSNSNLEHNQGGEFVLSGIDILAGGTWLGMNRHGDVALLTNITEPSAKLISSRGHLCSSFLLRNKATAQITTLSNFVDQLTTSETRYAGFNMLLLAPERARRSTFDGAEEYTIKYDSAVLSNGGAGKTIRAIPPAEDAGCHCITNDTMNGFDSFTGLETDQEWPKAVQGRELFSDILSSDSETEEGLIEQLFTMLRTKKNLPPRNRQEFQETIMVDAVDLLSLRGRSSFVQTPRTPDSNSDGGVTSDSAATTHKSYASNDISPQDHPKYYATRLSSVLLVRKDGRALFVERDAWILDKDDRPILVEQEQYRTQHERRYSFQII